MIKHLNNKENLVIVLHEIYGINRFMGMVCGQFAADGFDVLCPNLLKDGQTFDYADEQSAYLNFMDHIGFEAAVAQIKDLVKKYRYSYKNIILVGFSIGATIAWLCSEKAVNCDGIIAYYGSRIRDNLAVEPGCPVLLLFPEEEKSFNVQGLAERLSARAHVSLHILKGKHGFADPFSRYYCKESSQESNALVKGFLETIIS